MVPVPKRRLWQSVRPKEVKSILKEPSKIFSGFSEIEKILLKNPYSQLIFKMYQPNRLQYICVGGGSVPIAGLF